MKLVGYTCDLEAEEKRYLTRQAKSSGDTMKRDKVVKVMPKEREKLSKERQQSGARNEKARYAFALRNLEACLLTWDNYRLCCR